MPENVSALVSISKPGQELTCKAQNAIFEKNGLLIEHGVLSYYAIATLPTSLTMDMWLEQINKRVMNDLTKGKLKTKFQLSLKILGATKAQLPGKRLEK
ncbi:MAG: hypothetical protein AB1489_39735 [Acidobacteriota bacterium]